MYKEKANTGRENEMIKYLTQKNVRKERKKERKRTGGSNRKQYNGGLESRSLNSYGRHTPI